MVGSRKVENDFGDVLLSQNSNTSNFGEQNTGTVSNNSNVKVTAKACNLLIIGNSNTICESENSEITVKNSSNLRLAGSNIKTYLESNSNFTLEGNDTKITASSNSNFRGSDKSSKLILNGNSNILTETSNAEIKAEGNRNLRIFSQDSKLTVENTSNHNLQSSNEFNNGVPINKLELSKGSATGFSASDWISSWFSSSPQNLRVNVDYVGQAKVDGPSYSLGIFNFTLKPKSAQCMELRLENADVSTKTVDHGLLELTATNGNVKQKLQLKAPIVQSAGEDGIYIFNFCERQSNV